jgi:hypothetical protein
LNDFELFQREPIALKELLWPSVTFYDRQVEIIKSVRDNDETFVVAGNKLGKDFVAAFIVLWFFLTRHPCRVVTTSAKDDHLDVLWGEIGSFVQSCKYPLDFQRGGPLIINQREITKHPNPKYGDEYGNGCALSYIKGMVAGQQSIAALGGHHIAETGDGVPRTLFVGDEASSIPEMYWLVVQGWSNRRFIFGNSWPCANFFYHAFHGKPGTADKGGDILAA